MDAVKDFAGADEGKPVIYPKAEALLIAHGRTLTALSDRDLKFPWWIRERRH